MTIRGDNNDDEDDHNDDDRDRCLMYFFTSGVNLFEVVVIIGVTRRHRLVRGNGNV